MNRPTKPGFYWFRGIFTPPNSPLEATKFGEAKRISCVVEITEIKMGTLARVKADTLIVCFLNLPQSYHIYCFEGEWAEISEEELFTAG